MSPFVSSPPQTPPTCNFSFGRLDDLLRDLSSIENEHDDAADTAAPLPVQDFWTAASQRKQEPKAQQPAKDDGMSGLLAPLGRLSLLPAAEAPATKRNAPLLCLPTSQPFLKPFSKPVVPEESQNLPVSAGGRWGAEAIGEAVASGSSTSNTPPSSASRSSGTAPTDGALPTSATSSGQQAIERPKGAPAVDLAKFRTKVCRNWSMGAPCQFGERCAFAHGKEQVRSMEERNDCLAVYGNNGPKRRGGQGRSAGANAQQTQQPQQQQQQQQAQPQPQPSVQPHSPTALLVAAAPLLGLPQVARPIGAGPFANPLLDTFTLALLQQQQAQQQAQQQQRRQQQLAKMKTDDTYVDPTGCTWFC
ncbi:hypothetical protein DIPPA_17161 [Diplonema papillatum]|nr:hypothetical protein DIPPA_17161 [Diplonema papillatum]